MQFINYHQNNVTIHVFYGGQTVQVSLSDIAGGYFSDPELGICARRIRKKHAARGFAAFLRSYSPEESEPVLYSDLADALFDFDFIIRSANYYAIPRSEAEEESDVALRAESLDMVVDLLFYHAYKRGFPEGYSAQIYHRGGLTVIPLSPVELDAYIKGRISALQFVRLMLRKEG